MFSIGWTEILIFLLIMIIVFGLPKFISKFPQIGEGLGKGIKNFQKALKDKSRETDEGKKEDTSKKD